MSASIPVGIINLNLWSFAILSKSSSISAYLASSERPIFVTNLTGTVSLLRRLPKVSITRSFGISTVRVTLRTHLDGPLSIFSTFAPPQIVEIAQSSTGFAWYQPSPISPSSTRLPS